MARTKQEKPLLKIKITGPSIKPGRIPIPLLLKICGEAQAAINKQAEAIESRKSNKPDTAEPIIQECALELIALKKGSATLHFAAISKQLSLPEMESIRVEAVSSIAATLRSVNRPRGRWKPPDPGVLDALDDLGSVFDGGVNKLKWIVPPQNHHKGTTADFLPATRPKIKRRKQESLTLEGYPFIALPAESTSISGVPIQESFFEGMLEVTDGKARIRPVFGSPTLINFGADKADNVLEAMHKPVRVRVDPKSRKLVDIEITAAEGLDSEIFFASKSIDKLIAEQGIHPITKLELLDGDIPDEDIDEMVAQTYEYRRGQD